MRVWCPSPSVGEHCAYLAREVRSKIVPPSAGEEAVGLVGCRAGGALVH